MAWWLVLNKGFFIYTFLHAVHFFIGSNNAFYTGLLPKIVTLDYLKEN